MTGGAPDLRDIRAPLLLAASAPMILGPTMHLGAWFVVVAVLTLLLAVWVVVHRAPLAVPAVAARRLERSVFLLLTVVGLLGAIALVPSRLDGAGRWALVAAVGACGVALVVAAWTERRRLMLVAGIGYVAALAISARLAVVHLDVLTFHDGAARALLHGISPYGITYPNPFDARETQAFYGSGLATPDRILVGYPYPPVSLLLVLPGYVLGDTRFAMVAAVAVTSLVLHRYVSRSAVAPTWLASAAPVLLLMMPGMVYVVRNGWTEPLVLVLLALTVVSARRGWRATPYLLGAFLVTKQYSVLLLPLLWLLVPTARRSTGGVRGFSVLTVLTGLVLTLPLAAVDPAGFWRSIVGIQLEQPLRRDSLSLAAVLCTGA